MDPAIRASPYESGLYFVSPEPGTTLQSIGTTEWKVGDRYKLQKVLGYGSFSCVCLAIDTITGERVALKRIGDVLHSAEQAKRVLREISILRRTAHPNLIGLRDCFLRPSTTGQCRMVNGRLVNCSIDLYIAMEFADGGDLFHMRGQLNPAEVTSLLWQLLQAVQYLHSLHIWHRDIKSQNAFIYWERGVRVIKLGDFGSARSALVYDLEREDTTAYATIIGSGNNTTKNRTKSGRVLPPEEQQAPRPLSAAERSFKRMDEAMQTEDLYANLAREESIDTDDGSIKVAGGASDLSTWDNNEGEDRKSGAGGQISQTGGGQTHDVEEGRKQNNHGGLVMNMAHSKSSHGRGFKAPLTRVVATPCYRAPEVVMSRGGYSSALDMWGIGCIFGELLQRAAYIGSASNPNLAVAPLFALRCFPKTPETGETFGRPECAGTRRELQALFDVLGTPSWRDAAAVEMEEWRRYLERLPGKAPTLYRRFKPAGEVAIHLLNRLLDFDPMGRAACEEALAHEFFTTIREELNRNAAGNGTATTSLMAVPPDTSTGIGTGNDGGGSGFMVVEEEDDAAMMMEEDDEQTDGDVIIEERENITTVATNTAKDGDILSVDMRVLSFEGPLDVGETLSVDAAAAAATFEALHSSQDLKAAAEAAAAAAMVLEEANPGKALALLEEELEIISESAPDGLLDPASDGAQRLRQLLESEVEAAAASAAARTALRTSNTANAAMAGASGGLKSPTIQLGTFTHSGGGDGHHHGGGIRGNIKSGGGYSAKIDLGSRGDSLDYGRERLSNVADTVQGRELDPNKFLGSRRHGEWTSASTGGGVAPGPRWGVTAGLPGLNSEDPRVKEIIKKQQGR